MEHGVYYDSLDFDNADTVSRTDGARPMDHRRQWTCLTIFLAAAYKG